MRKYGKSCFLNSCHPELVSGSIPNFWCQNKKIILALALFVLVVCFLGLPYTNWGFKTDDFGNIFHCKIYSWLTIKQFFTEGNMERFNHPSNGCITTQSFFCGLYRPVSFIYYFIQYYFFETSPYGYFLVTIIFHALNSVLLFYLFTYIFSLLVAFLAALMFAFHPSLYNWLGWVSAQTYFIELFVLLLLIFALKKYIDTRNILFYILSCFLFLLNLFLKEATVFLPVWVMFGVYLYKYSHPALCFDKLSTSAHPELVEGARRRDTGSTSLRSSLLLSLGYWLVSIFYCLVRLSMFPLNSNTGTLTFEPTLISFITRMKSRVFDFVTYVTDMIGLSWISGDHRVIKGLIVASLFALLIILFIKSSKKIYITFCFLSMLMFSWPALLMHYQPRYIYMAIPFFIVFVFLVFESAQYVFSERILFYLKRVALIFVCLFTVLNVTFLMSKLRQREAVFGAVTQTFKELLAHDKIKNRALCFMGLPTQWFAMGTAQAIWLLSGDSSYPVYQEGPVVGLVGYDSYLQKPVLDQDYLDIKMRDNGFEFTSRDPEKLWFISGTQLLPTVFIEIPEAYRKQDPVYITWDYHKAQFKILKL